MSPRKNSFLTVTDQFCGAGGSSIGASAAGLEIRMAMNHWDLAVETHNTNFPDADHDCADISAADPRRYPSTDILITSPECTTHSPAGGSRHRKSKQRDLFVPTEEDPETARSRATMWDVVRFAEYHEYRAIIVENVVEVVRDWVLFHVWWQAMENLGYTGQMVSLNSMFALFDGMTTPAAPQSRDRIYIVWTRDRRRKPDLRIEPTAPCAKCGVVEARQTWRTGRRVGKHGARNQYWYTCPTCRDVVMPYYFCALNAIDFSIPATRIGDRDEPLKPKTRARVLYGLDKYGKRPLQVTTNNISGVACRVRGVDDPLFGQTGSLTTALVSPWLVPLSQSSKPPEQQVRSATGPVPARTTADDLALAGIDPFMYVARENVKAKSLLDAAPGMVASANQVGLVSDRPTFTPFIAVNRTHNNGNPLDGPAPAVVTGTPHVIIQPSALVRLNGSGRPVHPLDAPHTTTTGGADQHMLISPAPFLIQYYGSENMSSVDESVPSITTKDRHALVGGSLNIDDCYFRMFAVPEVQATMAFHQTYIVKGTKGKQIKQLGNAVTPPAMELLIQRIVQFLAGTRSLPVRAA
jgi:DNA (cytosine-5)-methyltransferase 1